MKHMKNGTGQPHFDILASVMVDILHFVSQQCRLTRVKEYSHLSSKPRQLSATVHLPKLSVA